MARNLIQIFQEASLSYWSPSSGAKLLRPERNNLLLLQFYGSKTNRYYLT